MIQCIGAEAKRQGRELTVVTGLDQLPDVEVNVQNFPPVGSFSLPEYESQNLGFPPFLEVIEYLERQRFGELIISTPGPLGLTALAAGRLLGIPLSAIYHTDFPKYVRFMTQDEALEQLTWRYMHWFYDQMQTIHVPSEFYRRQLVENGFDSRKLQVLKRGVDVERFSPEKRDASFWPRRGARNGFTFLYVGRVSKEKNLDLLLASFEGLLAKGLTVDLAIVGDGPYLPALRERYRHPEILFAGYLDGEELARAFSSADAFVFPSTTDTFGNVVLEAQASGLAAIVSNQGGPAEVVEHRRAGLIFDTADPDSLAAAMSCLRRDETMRARFGQAALQNARHNSWAQVLDHLWSQGSGGEPGVGRESFHRIRNGENASALMNLDVA
jgi:glycosyltransferase involved in cell wall biosynthesis